MQGKRSDMVISKPTSEEETYLFNSIKAKLAQEASLFNHRLSSSSA